METCKIIFDLLWHMRLAPLHSVSSRPSRVGPITALYLIGGGFDTMNEQRSALRHPEQLLLMCHIALIGCRFIQWRPEAFWSARMSNTP